MKIAMEKNTKKNNKNKNKTTPTEYLTYVRL